MVAEKRHTLRLSAPEEYGQTAHLFLDDKEISAQVTGVVLDVSVDNVNKATVTYSCQVMEVEGIFKVTHVCPIEVSHDPD